ncbi:hypothetical protein I7I48_04046 [Histoplasma ohiense]|nr:hypothetical protein I7I48_04046 [Histoplasma ohiense (nom. inval.)]
MEKRGGGKDIPLRGISCQGWRRERLRFCQCHPAILRHINIHPGNTLLASHCPPPHSCPESPL